MWKQYSYIRKGISHEKDNKPCQDRVHILDNDNWIVAALADGLGSLPDSDIAAKAAVETVCNLIVDENTYKKKLSMEDEFQDYIVTRVTDAIANRAAELGIPITQMNCTLVFAAINKQESYAIIGQIGDSAILIIKESKSVAMNDGNHSANETYAILGEQAAKHFFIKQIDIEKEQVLGFILCSDGLDNELYMKGSSYVNQITQLYFNAVSVEDNEEKTNNIISKHIDELTSGSYTPFDDDISIAILAKSEHPIMLSVDPTWLCSCGTRNEMQRTYCKSCNNDFVELYQNVRFKDYGGKVAFFTKINQTPEEEKRIIYTTKNPITEAISTGRHMQISIKKAYTHHANEIEKAIDSSNSDNAVPDPPREQVMPLLDETHNIDSNTIDSISEISTQPASKSPFQNQHKKNDDPIHDETQAMQDHPSASQAKKTGEKKQGNQIIIYRGQKKNTSVIILCIGYIVAGVLAGALISNLISSHKLIEKNNIISALIKDKQDLITMQNTMEQQIKNLSSENQNLEESFENDQKTIDLLLDESQALTTSLDKKEQEIDILLNKNKTITAELSEARNELNLLSDDKQQLTTAYLEMQKKVETLTDKTKVLTISLNSVQQKVTELMDENEELHTALDEAQQRENDLSEKNEFLTKTLEETKQKLSLLSNKNEQLEMALAEAQQKLQEISDHHEQSLE